MKTHRTIPLLGLPICDTTLAEAAAALTRRAVRGQRTQVCFVNAHCVNVAARDPTYLATLQNSDLLYADGSGMRIAARLAGHKLRANVNGTDLFPLLCREASAVGLGIALLGARPGVAERCAENMTSRYPGLRIVWTHHGYLPATDHSAMIDSLNDSGADMLFVAMGVPAQELWVASHAVRIAAPVTLAVGALFDFYAGDVPRAPVRLRALGLEWVWRLLLEPRRLFGRYVLGNPLFLARIVVRRVMGIAHLRHSPLNAKMPGP